MSSIFLQQLCNIKRNVIAFAQASTMLHEKTKEIVYMYMCGKQEGWLKFIYWTKKCQICMSVRAH